MIDADRLIARIMRYSLGDLKAQWRAGGIIRVIEEECDVEKFTTDRIQETEN